LKRAYQAVAVAIAVAGKRKGITTFTGGGLQLVPKQIIITFLNLMNIPC